ncbi:hypothetical protein FQN50_006449 [Emmonsiellopsis sp. PD_5]|nr:hypothetical protein FQN50_006449 [Emmonsiellopsis sp. PD_5]
MDPETAAVAIPKLLVMTLIHRSQQTIINGRRIGEAIPQKHVNAVTLRMNAQEQSNYCASHLKHMKQPLTIGKVDDGSDAAIQDSTRVRALQVTSLFPKIAEFHRRVGVKKTRAAALKTLSFQADFGLEFFIKPGE